MDLWGWPAQVARSTAAPTDDRPTSRARGTASGVPSGAPGPSGPGRRPMTALAERLIHLLDGDVVELETDRRTITAAVETNAHVVGDDGTDRQSRHRIGFMPIGEDATTVTADRFSVTVEPAPDGGWVVGDLVAEVFVEPGVGYEERSEGALVDVRKLDGA